MPHNGWPGPEPSGIGGRKLRVSDRAAVMVGAGPTELMLAGDLALAGVDIVIVERCASQHVDDSRARGLNPRTFEVPRPGYRRRPASRVKIGWHPGRAGAGSDGSGRSTAGKGGRGHRERRNDLAGDNRG